MKLMKEKPPSVLLLGLDSISRLNFHRMLPLTKSYLDATNWIEYKGYNKVGENTFPNLMALLTGRNMSGVYENCNPYHVGLLDRCNYIWKNFSDSNYVTAYIEDAISISTFTFLKKGFLNPPTDYYFKPYMTAAEDLGKYLLDDMYFCSGPKASGERILEAAKDFISQLSDQPKFGLFWSNTFSHDNINTPARMDKILADFFKDIHKYLTNTIVLFFSDHGMRFGSIRETKTGWYEERLPFAYFWVPPEFQNKYPTEYINFIKNSDKLTTPYDIYITMQHLLELYDDKKNRSNCDSMVNCKSLFEDVGDRSCEDLKIPLHYCTCFGYKPSSTQLPLIQHAADVAVGELNKIIRDDINTSTNCAEYRLNKVTLAQTAIYKNVTYLLFQLQTMPKAIFEFTMSFNQSSFSSSSMKRIEFKREDEISRLDKYEHTSKCVTEKKLYCYCRSNVQMYMNFFSFWFEV
nr:uncharacterized protein LOC111417886 [Onthophagus taurus]